MQIRSFEFAAAHISNSPKKTITKWWFQTRREYANEGLVVYKLNKVKIKQNIEGGGSLKKCTAAVHECLQQAWNAFAGGIIAREAHWCGCTCTRTHWWTDPRSCGHTACSPGIRMGSSRSSLSSGWRVCRWPSHTPCCWNRSLSCSRLPIVQLVRGPSRRCLLVLISGYCWAVEQQSALHYTIVQIEPLFCTDVFTKV